MVLVEICCPGELRPAVASMKGVVAEATEEAIDGFRLLTNPPDEKGYPGLSCTNAPQCDNFDCPFHGGILWSRETTVYPEVGDPELANMKDNPDDDDDDEYDDDFEDDDDDFEDDPYADDDEDEEGWETDDDSSGSIIDEIVSTTTGLLGKEVMDRVGTAAKEEIGDALERGVRKAVRGTVEKIVGPPDEEKKEEKKKEKVDGDDGNSFGISIE